MLCNGAYLAGVSHFYFVNLQFDRKFWPKRSKELETNCKFCTNNQKIPIVDKKSHLMQWFFNSFSLWIIGNTLHITRFRLCKLCTWFYCHISKKKISLISTYSSLVCIKLHQESLYSVWHMLFVYHELCQHLCSVNYNYFHETFLQSDIFVYYPLSILILYYAFLLLA